MQIYQDLSYLSEQKSDPKLTPHAIRLLEALRNASAWINRSSLARQTGKSALNRWNLVLLQKLNDTCLIESHQISRSGPIGYEWQYRAIPTEEELEQKVSSGALYLQYTEQIDRIVSLNPTIKIKTSFKFLTQLNILCIAKIANIITKIYF